MIDRKQIKIQEQVERPVAAGAEIANEGVILVEAIENGVSKVSVKATVDGSEKIAGVALLPYMLPATAVANEAFTVPATGSLVFNLRNANLVAGADRAMVVGGSDLTIDETAFSATPATGTVKVDLVGGRIKFAAGDAGKVVHFLYRYNLTVQQARQRFHERALNNRDLVGNFALVGVAKGYVEIATDQFDPSKDYSTGAALTLGDNGIITIGGAGVELPQAKVLALPDLSGSLQGAMLRVSMLIG
jgi:hypothetical protein